MRRNGRGDDRLYMSDSADSYTFLRGLYQNKANFENEASLKSDAVSGLVLLAQDCVNVGGYAFVLHSKCLL